MIKRLFLLAFVAGLYCFTAVADEQKKVVINNTNHKTETIDFATCQLTASLINADEDDNVTVSLHIDNIGETYTILLFDKAYNEKMLTKLPHSITIDKSFPGDKGKRNIDFCPELKSPREIRPNAKDELLSMSNAIDSSITIRLPFYLAKYKGKNQNKLLIISEEILELEIQTNVIDDDYLRLSQLCDSIKEEIGKTVFCTNKRHKGPSAKQLTQQYKAKINDVKDEIGNLTHDYMSSSKKYKRYNAMYEGLDSIDFQSLYKEKCPKCHGIPPIPYPDPRIHRCGNCSMSYKAIYDKVSSLYLAIHNGKMTKQQALNVIKPLSTCMSKNKKRPDNPAVKSRIDFYVSKINAL